MSKKLHDNTVGRKCRAYVIFNNGCGQIAEYRLDGGGRFTLSEMRQWIIKNERKNGGVKTIRFLEVWRKPEGGKD